CAGCVNNANCPTYDRGQNYQHVDVGKGVPGLQLRVRLFDGNSPSAFADAGEVGLLELSGDVVFDGYFNDRDSTAAAFTSDGWFITGNVACVNHNAQSSDTEQIVVAYLPSVEDNDIRARTKTRNRIVEIIGLHMSSSAIVLPLTAADLKPSALGKLPKRCDQVGFREGHVRPASP
ncbi:hypothetical protein CPAR01_11577, partial [Colletotrichum paranaense]